MRKVCDQSDNLSITVGANININPPQNCENAGMPGPTKFAYWLDERLTGMGRGAQADLARALGISSPQVQRMRAREGKESRKPQPHELPIIAEFFGVQIADLPLDDIPARVRNRLDPAADTVRLVEQIVKRYPESRQAIHDLVLGIVTRLEARK